MSSVGFDRETWQPLIGWDHVRQSLAVILTTEIGERVQRRPFGSAALDMIDKPQNLDTIMDLYVAVAEAIEPRVVDGVQLGEPRFLLSSMDFQPSPEGQMTMNVTGTYFPRGHLGDFSRSTGGQSISIPIGAAL